MSFDIRSVRLGITVPRPLILQWNCTTGFGLPGNIISRNLNDCETLLYRHYRDNIAAAVVGILDLVIVLCIV